MFDIKPDDPSSLRFIGVTLGGPLTHAAGTGEMGIGRIFREIAYGRAVAKIIRQLKPSVVLCGNTPADAQRAILSVCAREGVPFVYWLQDIYSVAVATLLTKKFGYAGKMVGWYYQWLDRKQFRASDAIIAISEDFPRVIASWIGDTPVAIIENWAAITDLPVGSKDNPWSRGHGLQERFAFIYSGTLGRKHNPHFLLKLAERCGVNSRVVAIAQGFGVPLLREAKAAKSLESLMLLPIQPATEFANVLASADVLLATIELEAGVFAVPSKVLSYLCSGRPILLAASHDNLAARIVASANAGIVVDPRDETGFIAAANRLHAEPGLCAELGANGRRYAEETFDIARIADRFEIVLTQAGRRAISSVGELQLASALSE
jgi:glycosyltransferase involved in cell wall biosynthesis